MRTPISTSNETPRGYEPPTITSLGTLVQATAGTGTVATRDPQGTSV